jgi:O-antigen/teichoic acid export membrane protein
MSRSQGLTAPNALRSGSAWATSVRERLAKAMWANVFGQVVTILIQFLSLPILIYAWGVEVYGVWLVLWAICTYLSFLDFGFGAAAGNDMVRQVVGGKSEEAVSTFQALALLTLLMAICAGIAMINVVTFFPWSAFFKTVVPIGDLRIVILAACAYTLTNLQMSVAQAGFRANGSYALGSVLSDSLRAIEGVAMLTVAALGGGLVSVAVVLASLRIAGTMAVFVILHHEVQWLTFGFNRGSLSGLKRLWRPAFAVMLFPAAFAISLQGMTLLIAALSSLEAVVLFSTVRTVTRLGLQAVGVVTNGVRPEYSAAAHNNPQRLTGLVVFNLVAAISIALLIALGLIIGGRWFVHFWSGGKIEAPLTFIGLMSGVMVVQAISTVPLNLLLSVNRHAVSGLVMVGGAIFALAGCAVVLPLCGVDGAAGVLLFTEMVMAVFFFEQVTKSSLLAGHRQMGVDLTTLQWLAGEAVAAIHSGAEKVSHRVRG